MVKGAKALGFRDCGLGYRVSRIVGDRTLSPKPELRGLGFRVQG